MRSMRGWRAKRNALAVLVAAASTAACTDAAGYDLDYILSRAPFVATLRTSVAYEAQELPLLPPPNTVPVAAPGGEILAPFDQTQLDSVAATLSNPLSPTPEVLARGEQVFETFCYVCHGTQGTGAGPVVGPGKFPLGPSLVGPATAARSGGYQYAVVRVGRGLMPGYGDRVPHLDRWAVVTYLQQLQGQGGAVAPAPDTAVETAPAPVAEPAAGEPAGGAP